MLSKSRCSEDTLGNVMLKIWKVESALSSEDLSEYKSSIYRKFGLLFKESVENLKDMALDVFILRKYKIGGRARREAKEVLKMLGLTSKKVEKELGEWKSK